MATIGSWGSGKSQIITFTVTSKKQLTLKDMKRTVSGRWKTHNIIGKKPKLEFAGPDLVVIEMTVRLSARSGVKPLTILGSLRSACVKGTADYLYIRGKKVCANRLVLSEMTEAWDEIWSKGELVSATVGLTFTEYITSTKPKPKTPSNSPRIKPKGTYTIYPEWVYKVAKKIKKKKTIYFIGGKVYKTKNAKQGKKRHYGLVKIKKVAKKGKHKYKIKSSNWRVSHANGWVDKKLLKTQTQLMKEMKKNLKKYKEK